MNAKQEKAKANLLDLVSYFKGIAAYNGWLDTRRNIEYEVAFATTDLILAKDQFVESDFAEIAAYINRIVSKEHANGSGWMDFQARISYFFLTFGYQSDWNDVTGEFTFDKAES